jgi:hypothetical protein
MVFAKSLQHAQPTLGRTVAQLEAIFDREGGTMASLYSHAADRRRLALEGMHMLANNHRTSIAARR